MKKNVGGLTQSDLDVESRRSVRWIGARVFRRRIDRIIWLLIFLSTIFLSHAFECSPSKPDILPNSEFQISNPSHYTAVALVILLLLLSIRAWVGLIQAISNKQPWLDWSDEPRAAWSSFSERTVVALMILLLGLHLAPKFAPSSKSPTDDPKIVVERVEPTETTDNKPLVNTRLKSLIPDLILRLGIALLLPAILVCSDRPMAVFGIKFNPFIAQARDGVNGFLLALAPMSILMLATARLRNRETQNPLLTLLSDSPDPLTVATIWIAAVVIAPLFEEMLFRVILQGWLSTKVAASEAIAITAVAFAAIHGVTDGLALIPLALILGYVFHRRHSYVSVLVIHGLFNATMLTLALLMQSSTGMPQGQGAFHIE